jgi:hypothetical protein
MRTLEELWKNPNSPLTVEEWNNFDKIMRMTNDDKPASEVDIGPGIRKDIREIRRRGTYWW